MYRDSHLSSFNINLMSGCSMDYYPNNTLSKFTVKLPYSLNLLDHDKWHVGITQFACTSIKKDILFKSSYISPSEENIIYFKPNANVKRLNIIDVLQCVPSFFKSIESESFFKVYKDENFKLTQPTLIQKTFVRFHSDQNVFDVPTNMLFTPRNLFNYYFSIIPFENWDSEVNYLENMIQSWNAKLFPSQRTVPFEQKINYHEYIAEYKTLNYLCIYSDIIKPRIVGDRISRSLLIHPIKNENDWLGRNVIDIKNVEYYPIESSNISEINILLADETGEQINFIDSSFSTMLNLHFKKDI